MAFCAVIARHLRELRLSTKYAQLVSKDITAQQNVRELTGKVDTTSSAKNFKKESPAFSKNDQS